jgi:hypothetical protein
MLFSKYPIPSLCGEPFSQSGSLTWLNSMLNEIKHIGYDRSTLCELSVR